MTTLAERWTAEGEARGVAKGRVEGARRVLLQILQLKFGELPSAQQERFQAASEEEIARWTTRVLTADSLADVLAD